MQYEFECHTKVSIEDVVKQRLKMYVQEMRLERFSGTIPCVKDAQNFG